MRCLVQLSHLVTAGKVGYKLHRHILDLIGNYRVSRKDIEENIDLIILLANELGGPQVTVVGPVTDPRAGTVGLVADRDYKKGEFVTTFGGYTLSHRYCGFLVKEKGCWIRNIGNANVELDRIVRTTRAVRKAEEFRAHILHKQ